jgi:hypothetical protein
MLHSSGYLFIVKGRTIAQAVNRCLSTVTARVRERDNKKIYNIFLFSPAELAWS